jgi:TldD protein
MSQPIDTATRLLLEPTGLDNRDLSKTLDRLMSPQIDYADLYFQYSRHESWSLDEGTVKSGSFGIDQGVGVRAVSGEKTGFAYSDEILLPALENAADAAKAIAGQGVTRAGLRIEGQGIDVPKLYQPVDPLGSMEDADKVALLKEVEQLARKIDPRITQVMVSLSGVQDIIMVARSDGLLAADIRPLVRMNVSVIVDHNGRREQGSSGGGGRYSYQYFTEQNRASEYAEEAVRQALVNLESREAPAGEMTVVLGSGWPGILLHEAIGHGLEGDFNRKGTSAFSGRIGEKVASDLCTVVDDGTIPGRRGSLSIDDEGMQSQNTVLIENGVLTGYMQDQQNARLMGMDPTGNGRRESYAHLPMPRMTNTYMHAGEHDPEEIIASVDKGIYAANFGGGQVDITSGKFVFSASEAYMIENGKKTYPVKGATLIGNGPEVLTRVSMLGNDLALDSGVGVCGKEGQSVPVGVGQPTMRIDGLTVGGVSV